MKTKQINELLRNEARGLKIPLCDKWFNEWDLKGDKQYLIDLYLRGIDFPIANDWPSLEFITENFDSELLRTNGILVNDTYSFANKSFVVLLGDSKSTVRNNGRNICTVYVRHHSTADIFVKNMSFCTIHLFDSASVNVESEDKATAIIIKHSCDSEYNVKGRVKIKEDLGSFK